MLIQKKSGLKKENVKKIVEVEVNTPDNRLIKFLQQSCIVFLFVFYLFVFWYSYFVCRYNICITIIRNRIYVFHGYGIRYKY